jgi:hypothetical protein
MQCLEYSQIRVSFDQMPSRFIRDISQLINDVDRRYFNCIDDIQEALENLIQDRFPELLDLGREIVRVLDSRTGVAIVKNLPLLQIPTSDRLVKCIFYQI